MGHNCRNKLENKNIKKDMQCTAYWEQPNLNFLVRNMEF
jgi:hypothetical protein